MVIGGSYIYCMSDDCKWRRRGINNKGKAALRRHYRRAHTFMLKYIGTF